MTNTPLPYPLNMLLDAYMASDRMIPGLDNDRQKGLNHIMQNVLSDREEAILRARYQEQKSLEDVAGDLDITRQRVREIEKSALQKIGKPDNIAYVEEGYMIASGEVDRRAKERVGARLERKLYEYSNQSVLKLTDLGISNRALNALRRNGIETVKQLLETSEDEMRRWSGFGLTCMKDVLAAKEKAMVTMHEQEDSI